MKLCECKLDDTLSQNTKIRGCRSTDGFRKQKINFLKKRKRKIIFFKENDSGIRP